MIRLYTELNHYNPKYRKYLVDIFRPMIPVIDFNKYGVDSNLLKIENNIINSDICILPMAWNYYLTTNQIYKANDLIYKAKQYKKKIVVWVNGDLYTPIPKLDHIIVMSYSVYKTKINNQPIFSLPVIIEDPLKFLNNQAIKINKFNLKAKVGFCGHVDNSKIISFVKMLRLFLFRCLYKYNISKHDYGSIIPATYIRNKILNILESNSSLLTCFIRRSKYHGGANNKSKRNVLKEEFYNNIQMTDYTLCIRGTGNFSARLYETLALGKIPIYINTDSILPFDNLIDWEQHLIWIEYCDLNNIIEKITLFHEKLNNKSFKDIQLNNRKLWENYFQFSGFYKNILCELKKHI